MVYVYTEGWCDTGWHHTCGSFQGRGNTTNRSYDQDKSGRERFSERSKREGNSVQRRCIRLSTLFPGRRTRKLFDLGQRDVPFSPGVRVPDPTGMIGVILPLLYPLLRHTGVLSIFIWSRLEGCMVRGDSWGVGDVMGENLKWKYKTGYVRGSVRTDGRQSRDGKTP